LLIRSRKGFNRENFTFAVKVNSQFIDSTEKNRIINSKIRSGLLVYFNVRDRECGVRIGFATTDRDVLLDFRRDLG